MWKHPPRPAPREPRWPIWLAFILGFLLVKLIFIALGSM